MDLYHGAHGEGASVYSPPPCCKCPRELQCGLLWKHDLYCWLCIAPSVGQILMAISGWENGRERRLKPLLSACHGPNPFFFQHAMVPIQIRSVSTYKLSSPCTCLTDSCVAAFISCELVPCEWNIFLISNPNGTHSMMIFSIRKYLSKGL